MKRLAILGAGISGLALSYFLKDKFHITILEKKGYSGGLCQSFEIDGFWFDYGAHGAFSKNEEIVNLLEKDVDTECCISDAINFKYGKWIKQPVQNNLYPLEVDEKVKIIKDFLMRQDDGKYSSYKDWLAKKYGNYFAENYPRLYTRKYWTVEPEKLETKWVGSRMYTPDLDEVLRGSYTDETPNVHYSGTIRYPFKGGFASFLTRLSAKTDIIYNTEITGVDTQNKQICTSGGVISYDELISTIPLPELVHVMKDVPAKVNQAAEQLNFTTMVLVSLGIKKKNALPHNANTLYVYDEDYIISRAYSTSAFGRGNAPEGCSTIQAEIYFSKFRPMKMTLKEIENRVVLEFIDMGILQKEDIVVSDVRMVKYANIIFTQDIYTNRTIIHEYLNKKQIYHAGRFGEWDYLWSDQSIESAKNTAELLISKMS